MKETKFISENKDKWLAFEKLYASSEKDPEKLSELFVEITEDLSYAQTYYPRRSVRFYLNGLAQKVFNSLYKKSKRKSFIETFIQFWLADLPIEMYKARKVLLSAFIVFVASICIGWYSSSEDYNYIGRQLSGYYVNMTEDNIENGDPMAVYKDMEQLEMFLYIVQNNLRVDIICFIFGIFFSLGAYYILMLNGIMVGAFQFLFKKHGLLLTSFLTIWIHGTFELIAAVIAGTAGIVMGNGLIFTGTLTRMQSLQISAKRGVKILLGIMPFTFVAAILESYVTRHTEMPDITKWAIIILSFLIMLGYFVVYPFFIVKKLDIKEDDFNEKQSLFREKRNLKYYVNRGNNDTIRDTFAFYFRYFKIYIKWFTIMVLPVCVIHLVFTIMYNYDFYYYLSTFKLVHIYLGHLDGFNLLNFLFVSYVISANLSISYLLFNKIKDENYRLNIKDFTKYLIKIFPFYGIILLLIANIPQGFLLATVFFPFLFMGVFILNGEKFLLGKRISFSYKNFGNTIGLFLILLFMSITFVLLMYTPINFFLDEMINWHISESSNYYYLIMNSFHGFVFSLAIFITLPIVFIAYAFKYLSDKENEEAISINESLKTFGKKNKFYEL